jgi:sodium/proline symporter
VIITPIIGSFLLYFAILLGIGLVTHKKQTTSADFIMGNRTLNFWLTALTAHASDMSAWLFMAFPAAIFVYGMQEIWIAIGLILGMYCNWQFVASRLRIETEKLHSYTLSSYFEKRFQDNSGIIRVLTAAMTLFFMTSYLSGGLIAMGYLFESLFGMNYYVGLSIATLVVVTYTFVGGFVTVAWTDFFQGIFLFFIIIIVAIISFFHVGGWAPIIEAANSWDLSLSPLPDLTLSNLVGILFTASWGLGYFGMPHIVTKFLGIKNASEIRKSKYLGMTWMILALGAAAWIGLIGLPFFQGTLENPELVFVDMVKQLFTPGLAGFILCGVIAANMSTMDSQILVCASVLSEDFYKQILKKSANPLKLLRASRAGVLITAAVSLYIAFNKSASVMEVVKYAWSGLGCSFGPLVLMSLYSQKANKYGAIAGIFVGGSVAALWPALNPHITTIDIPSMIPGFFSGLAAIYVVSYLTSHSQLSIRP